MSMGSFCLDDGTMELLVSGFLSDCGLTCFAVHLWERVICGWRVQLLCLRSAGQRSVNLMCLSDQLFLWFVIVCC